MLGLVYRRDGVAVGCGQLGESHIPFLTYTAFFFFGHLLGDIGIGIQHVFTEMKNMDSIMWMDSLLGNSVRLPPSIQAIPCAP